MKSPYQFLSSFVLLGARGRGYSLYGKVTPERGTFPTLEVYERVGISRVEVYERVEKSVI